MDWNVQGSVIIYGIVLRFMAETYSNASQRKDEGFLLDKHKSSAKQLIFRTMGLTGDHWKLIPFLISLVLK